MYNVLWLQQNWPYLWSRPNVQCTLAPTKLAIPLEPMYIVHKLPRAKCCRRKCGRKCGKQGKESYFSSDLKEKVGKHSFWILEFVCCRMSTIDLSSTILVLGVVHYFGSCTESRLRLD